MSGSAVVLLSDVTEVTQSSSIVVVWVGGVQEEEAVGASAAVAAGVVSLRFTLPVSGREGLVLLR